MSIIIDTNVIPKVFNPDDSKHPFFKPIFDWIDFGSGILIYGGTKYINELNKMDKYAKLIKLYKDRRKALEVDRNEVDEKEAFIKTIEINNNFNDHHLIAIVIVSRVGLICTEDHNAIPYLKNRCFYPKGCIKVKIYTEKVGRNKKRILKSFPELRLLR